LSDSPIFHLYIGDKVRKTLIAGIAAAALAVSVAATPAFAATNITGAGSSFANNLLQKAAAAYPSDDGVTYGSVGSGNGRKNFVNSITAFAVSDTAFASTDSKPTAGTYTFTPLVGGPVAFVYNKTYKFKGTDKKWHTMPANLKITPEVISGILRGDITSWQDKAIKALNPKAVLPNHTIDVFYRSAGSGTNSNVTNYLAQVVGTDAWVAGGKNDIAAASVGGKVRGLQKANSALLSSAVQKDAYAFGYFDLSDAVTAPVNKFALKNKAGQYVLPTVAAGQKFLAQQAAAADSTDNNKDGIVTLDFTKSVSGAYQLTILTYGLGKRGSSAAADVAVEKFFNYIVTSGNLKAWELSHGYVPLPDSLKTVAVNQIAGIANN
jgi:phosphate transport system substrate-binding protein